MNRTPSRNKGFILVGLLATCLVLLIIAIPLLTWTVNEFSWTNLSYKTLRALNLADAGAERAIWEIMYNNADFTGWSGGNPQTLTITDFTDNSGAVIGDISMTVNTTAPDHYFIVSTGETPSSQEPIVMKTVKVEVFPHSLFNNGIFGFSSVLMHGNATADSYDSHAGPYNPASAGSNADIGSNGSLDLQDNSEVYGDIFIAPGGSVTGNDATHLSGTTYYTSEAVEPASNPNIADLTVLASGGNLLVDGNIHLTLPTGDYRYESITVEGHGILTISSGSRVYIHNDLSVDGQAKIVTDGDVQLYIGGNANIAGKGIVNSLGAASELQIYSVGVGTNFSFTGTSDFYGTLFAPFSSAYLAGGADFHGAVLADSVELAGNLDFHYDEALTQDGPFEGFDISYWLED